MSGARRAAPRVKDLPPAERPRERLLAGGAGGLSNADLIAILIGSGSGRGGESALDLARRLLAMGAGGDNAGDGGGDAAGLRWLASARAEELCRVPGIGPAKAAQLVAAAELGRRMAAARLARPRVRCPEDVSQLLLPGLRDLDREHFYVVLLNTRHYVLGVELISIGTLNGAMVHPREVFRAAIRRGAAALILAHNHPSGDPTPSPEDVQVTRRLVEAGRLMGIDVLDHVIIGDNRYQSLRELGMVWDG